MLTSYLFAAVAALATGVTAQTAAPSGTSSASPAAPSSSGKVVEIAVGSSPHKFTPETVEAEVGDIIRRLPVLWPLIGLRFTYIV